MMTLTQQSKHISLRGLIGGGYDEYIRFKGRYRVCKGSRGSKKSKTTAIDFIIKLMQYPDANLLVIRKVGDTLRTSCYADLMWAIHKIGVDHLWEGTTHPLELTYKPTGQKIYFRGLDNPLKITSIAVSKGVLCWCWFEESYEIMDENDFNTIDESIRGEVPEGLWKQLTLTFNPWNERHWLKSRFFDVKDDPEILAMTTTYECNEWLDAADLKVFERMKRDNPRRYKVAGLGEWGITEGVIYDNWHEERFDLDEIRQIPGIRSAFGLDFGYSIDPAALFCGLVDNNKRKIYVFDELYEKGLTNKMLFEKLQSKGYIKERIIADSAEPKSIAELWDLGARRVTAARKGKDSINNGIQYVQNYEIIIHPKCVNFLTEISNYAWDKDKAGNLMTKPLEGFDHLMDAMRYAMMDVQLGDTFSFD